MMHDQSADLRAEALALAQKVHSAQVDKLGNPYIEHVCAVASAVAHLGLEFEIVGLLHDSLEDCADRSLVSMDILIGLFGPDIADAVTAMTKQPHEDYETQYLPRVMSHPIAAEVKRADVAHNRSRLHLLDSETRSRLEAKYRSFSERYRSDLNFIYR
ncbi:HD domain protein [Rhodovulum sulfidophilum]|uniref:HD domain protein n=1 Tax=Rhodovulum sulfidophilum TaxID=35806 RepID=A0A0D6B5A8_RHOSU|nr:HD domain protein [Rhodovulum sulfidophilum]